MRSFLPAILMGLILMNSSQAAERIHTPEAGSAEREVLIEAARTPLARKLGQPVRFDVQALNVGGDWVFLYARLQDAGGEPVDWSRTALAGAAGQGYVSPVYVALLQREGEAWALRAEAIGPTDVAWQDWPAKYGAPQALFAID